MGHYIEYYDNFNKSKFRQIEYLEGKKECYIHISVLKKSIEGAIIEGYEILGWEAIIYINSGTLSPVELIVGTGPEIDKEIKNKNALNRDYLRFINLVEKRIKDEEYKKEDVYIDLILK